MSEATLNWVNSFTRFFEAAYNLRDIIRVSMTQTKLSITIIFSNSVNEALNTDKETKIEANRFVKLKNGKVLLTTAPLQIILRTYWLHYQVFLTSYPSTLLPQLH